MNPDPGRGLFTSRVAAESLVNRGHAVFVSDSEMRMLTPAEKFQEQALVVDMERDRQYWRDVAVQRGGKEVEFQWAPRMGANGMMGMEGRPVVVSRG